MFFDHLPGAGYVCAHRGARAHAPENTLLAAERCLEFGADYWEIDVHKIADGTLVVFHDNVLDRTTDIADHPDLRGRKSRRVHDYTWDELQRLDAGAWFASQDPFGSIGNGILSAAQIVAIYDQRIPSLRETLAFTRRHSLPINIEIKDQPDSADSISIVDDVLDMVHEMEVRELVLISSFNHDYLAEIHARDSEMPVALLVDDTPPDDIVPYLQRLGATCYHPDHRIVDASMIATLSESGIRVAPYTVNDMDRAVSLIHDGCFGIITDHPLSLRQRLAKLTP